jgi:hypothetical protein
MTPDEAAWVRANAWTGAMRKTYREVPAFYTTCACQASATAWCQTGGHDKCGRGEPLPTSLTVIVRRDGGVAHFAAPYAHPHRTATGMHCHAFAEVWLAGHVCAWRCRCPDDCHNQPVVPEPAAPEQLDLFAEAA